MLYFGLTLTGNHIPHKEFMLYQLTGLEEKTELREAIPCGTAITTAYWLNGEKVRQDIKIEVTDRGDSWLLKETAGVVK